MRGGFVIRGGEGESLLRQGQVLRWIGLLSGFEAISYPGFGHDVAGRGSVGFQFLAQLADEDAEIFHLLRTLSSPDRA